MRQSGIYFLGLVSFNITHAYYWHFVKHNAIYRQTSFFNFVQTIGVLTFENYDRIFWSHTLKMRNYQLRYYQQSWTVPWREYMHGFVAGGLVNIKVIMLLYWFPSQQTYTGASYLYVNGKDSRMLVWGKQCPYYLYRTHHIEYDVHIVVEERALPIFKPHRSDDV